MEDHPCEQKHQTAVQPPPRGVYPELFLNPSTVASLEDHRLKKFKEAETAGAAGQDDAAKAVGAHELELVFNRDASMITNYIHLLRTTKDVQYGIRALLLAKTTFRDQLNSTVNKVVNELVLQKAEKAVLLLENMGYYQRSCQVMFQTGDVTDGVVASRLHMTVEETLCPIVIPWIVQLIGKGYIIRAAVELLRIGAFVDAIRVLLYGHYFELAAHLTSVCIVEEIIPFEENIEVNWHTVIFDDNITAHTFKDLCRVTYKGYIDVLKERYGLVDVSEFYSFLINSIMQQHNE